MSGREETDERAVAAFAASLLARAAGLRLPELFCRVRPNALYQVLDRNGVSAVVIETSGLAEDELAAVLRFRLAQYLAVGFADARFLLEFGLEHEPLTSVPATDVHVLAGDAHSGEILCYSALRSLPPTLHAQRMRSRVRLPFPVEEAHGLGVFDRLARLPDFRVARVRELGRFVRNQRLDALDERGVRAAVEVNLGLSRTVVGPLRPEVDAVVGELEQSVAKRNLDFFHVPTAVIRGTLSYEESPSFLCAREGRAFYPFAFAMSDVEAHCLPRFDAIERALALPGRKGVRALLALKRSASPAASSLVPRGGLPPLAGTELPHAHLASAAREAMRREGELLRRVPPFDTLTTAEATVLRTAMARLYRHEGDVIVREKEHGDALFVVESGEAEVVQDRPGGQARSLARLRAGSCFGEIALVLPVRRTATVVARTQVELLRLTAGAYRRYLATIAEVHRGFTTTAVNRLARA